MIVHYHPLLRPPPCWDPLPPNGGMDDIDNFSLRARGVSESEEEGSEDKVDSYGSPFRMADSSDSESGIQDVL